MRCAKATVALAASLTVVLSPAAWAGESLIPTPYPSEAPGAAPLDPEPTPLGGPQRLLDDPYPQITGDFSQGNPPIVRHYRRQHLVKSIYRRKYRVERP